jgi:glycosyltransferase involved in cell wall biosynthesis
MLGLATTTIAGNDWLFDQLGLDEQRAVILPTSVWVDEAPVKEHTDHRPLTLGWIGVKSNLYHLQLLHDAFTILRDRYPEQLEVEIVSNEAITTPLPTRFRQWSLETEGESVLSFDVGLMPLQDDPFSRGKCAFKAVFCMSRGVPVVASPVGASTTLVESGVTGWLARSTGEWVNGIAMLLEDERLRRCMGRRARATVEHGYSAARVARELGRVLVAATPNSPHPGITR